MNRLHTLDYLRGIAASGIMVFHLLSWNYGLPDANSFMGKVGIYGVSIFYVLSGLTLYHVYFKKMEGVDELRKFAIKRIFRIYPLLWVVTILHMVVHLQKESLYTMFLNFTGLFGILRPWDYIGTGVWSIGNELAFYLLFPILIFFSKHYKPLLHLTWIILLALYVYFAFYLMNGEDWWLTYVNPLNQAFLFVAGFMMGFLKIKTKNIPAILLILIGLALFIITPAFDMRDLASRETRMIFTSLCIVICFGFYNLSFNFPKPIHWFFSRVGEASYSIYLLHPIVANLLALVFIKFPVHPALRVTIAIVVTLTVSYMCYITFEKFFIDKANQITRRKTVEPAL